MVYFCIYSARTYKSRFITSIDLRCFALYLVYLLKSARNSYACLLIEAAVAANYSLWQLFWNTH